MTLDQQLDSLISDTPGFWQRDACGVTRSQREIPVLLHGKARRPQHEGMQIALIGGLSGRQPDVDLVLAAMRTYQSRPGLSALFDLSAVPCGNPDGLALGVGPQNGAGGNPAAAYPPSNSYFYDPANPEAHYLWRWTSFLGPDLALEIRSGPDTAWEASTPYRKQWPHLVSALDAAQLTPDNSLLAALAAGQPNGLPPVPGLRLTCPPGALDDALNKLWTVLATARAGGHSALVRVLHNRVRRTPLDVARTLAATYGHRLDPVIYTQGVAVSGRLRLAALDPETADPAPDVAAMVEPYLSGERAWFTPAGDGGANLAGLVWADELSTATGNNAYADALLRTADRYRSHHDNGVPLPSHPNYQVEDMFFSAAVLGRAFKLTGDDAYLELLTRFLLDANVQQPDGLFWHDRLTPFYWGRGNGFAALSYAETLTYLPEHHPDRAAILAIHLRHLDALRGHQHRSGMWRQVINAPGSYLEMTVTCMIGYALARGLRRGWLNTDYRHPLTRAWRGVAARIDDDGGLVDVCTGTGVQKSLRDYLDRPAVFGPDERGGALSLWFVTELARLKLDTA